MNRIDRADLPCAAPSSHHRHLDCLPYIKPLPADRRVNRVGWLLGTCLSLVFLTTNRGLAEWLPLAAPADCQMDATRLAMIDELVAQGMREGKLPGCVVCIGRQGKIVSLKAYGNKQVEPTVEAMTPDTLFDMASITKPVATATSIMILVEQGKLSLSEPVAAIFPDFGKHGKESITIRDLLLHRSGLIPDNPMADYEHGAETAWKHICELKLVAPLGSAFKYSDVNFIVLGKVVEQLSGVPLDQFADQSIFRPLGMLETGYRPSPSLAAKAAPTEQREGRWMQGEVHDPRAYALGGVAGHAGLFSTARDLAIYAQMLLQRGTFTMANGNPIRILSPATVSVMTRAYAVPGGLRGLGWDKRTSYSSNRGDLFSEAAFGHGGFTGTVLWIDPSLDCFFIFLSNRVHPEGKGSVNTLAGKLANVVASSVLPPSHRSSRFDVAVRNGIDVLEQNGFRELADQRIGLITNHTGRNQRGMNTAVLLLNAPRVKLQALFSPEHGFEGKLDVARVGDSFEPTTGLKIFSLYGETRTPTASMLEDIDTLVFDIQDIGTRFYTYISTMGEAMRAAAEYGKRFVVLDRPNPIGGVTVTGPMLDEHTESFVAFHQLPVRHGMTIGELALMFRDELKLELELEIIPCEGWTRSSSWDATGLTWTNPSPNMRSLTQAFLYPGIGLLETTNLSVGRGTDTPFEVIGAPWMDGRQVAALMNQKQLAGVAFIPIEFTPTSSKYAQELCQGVNIQITDREEFEPIRVGLGLADVLVAIHGQSWQTKDLNRLLGNQKVFQTIVEPEHAVQREEALMDGMRDFWLRRQKYLLYEAP